MATIPTKEPSRLVKGDSVSWRRSLACYPASDGWTLTYYFRGISELDKAASADGDDYLVELSTSDAELEAGEYAWSAKVSKGSELRTVATGILTVLPDLADAADGYEARPHCKIMLDAIEAVLQGKASQDVSSYSIQGRSLTRMTAEELEKWRDKYRREWSAHKRREGRRNGARTGRQIKVRFN
ncbi:MAG: hypothetical protein ABW189_01340 [Rickettsiales bacterium]